jgi:cytochrome c553
VLSPRQRNVYTWPVAYTPHPPIYTCAGCHGVPGYTNAYPQYPVPKIAGQNEQYIVNALHGYKSGDRVHPTMDAQANSLSDTDIQNIAAYLSSLASK